MNEYELSEADVLVIFGITGDLAKKMTFQALYRMEETNVLRCPIVGVAVNDWSIDQLRDAMRADLTACGVNVKNKVFDRLAARLSYVHGDFGDDATFQQLASALSGKKHPLYYLEIPPFLFAPVVGALAKANLVEGATVMVEKPFGHDLDSAVELNEQLHQVLHENQILRVDHFLGKQPVADITQLRFSNALFEPVWNRDHIAGVYVTMAENFGVDDRGSFYDPVGALRDVVQNHLLQLVALIAMEAPVGPGPTALWDKKVDVFRAIDSIEPARCVRGQYDGYQRVKGVKEGSDTETYVALRFGIDNWRWSGVPFFVRAGKELPEKVTEVRIVLKRTPRLTFLNAPHHSEPNQIVIRIDPDAAMRLLVLSKDADGQATRNVHLDLPFAEELGRPPGPYERLFHDALAGDRSLFTREDAVEETWRILEPLIESPPKCNAYAKGTWGPEGAGELVRGFSPWHEPWMPVASPK
ncbi:MAG TPA: glucose-6-phosphate dehydrogenase [Acidimicrobiales bacterium]|jgi:glucose-6-phosphate 1-dehydrogenase